jgi:hypothetical protein
MHMETREFDHVVASFKQMWSGAAAYDNLESPYELFGAVPDGPEQRAVRAIVAGDPDQWSETTPTPALYLLEKCEERPITPSEFLENANFGNIMGDFYMRGEARFAELEDGGFVAKCALKNEQAEEDEAPTDIDLAVFPVREGLVIALLPGNSDDLALRLAQLASWPANMQTEKVYYGS